MLATLTYMFGDWLAKKIYEEAEGDCPCLENAG